MHRTHYVECCICKKNLAMWSGFGDNYQYQEEWACDNQKLREKLDPNSAVVFKKGDRVLKYLTLSCEDKNESVYCIECATKLNFKCKNCKTGQIILTRKA